MKVDPGRELRLVAIAALLWVGLAMMLAGPGVKGQDVPSPTELEMLLDGVQDARLREAMTKWHVRMEELQSQHRLHLLTPVEIGTLFAEPGRLNPALDLLKVALEAAPQEQRWPQVHKQLYGAVRAAVYSGRPESVPVLEALANSSDRKLRLLVLDSDLYIVTPNPPLGVQRAALTREAAELPVLRKGDPDSQAAWRAFTQQLGSYMYNVPPGERMAAKPAMKLALKRTEGWELWWRTKLEFDNMMMKKRVTAAEVIRQSEVYGRFQGKTSWEREGAGVLRRVLIGLAVCAVVLGLGRAVVR